MTDVINPARKIFAGPRLKRLRRERNLTQARMAEELAVSPSYLNLMERNQRPITVPVLIRLADIYGVDPRDFMEDRTEIAVEDMEHILADPLFRESGVGRAELHDAAEYAPALLVAMQRLYRAYAAARETTEAQVLVKADPDRTETQLGDSPVERVRTILQEARNHFPALDDAAEKFASDLTLEGPDPFFTMAERLRSRHGIRVRVLPVDVMSDRLRWYDLHRRQLMISEVMDQPGRVFQVAYQLAVSEHGALLNALAGQLEAKDDVARRLLRVTFANYFAGAVMMPYARFHEAAEATGYDVEVLAARFGASFEQVAHRMTTLGRATARGVPFFLVRVDIAGNVSKRFSAGRFPFSHAGGTCGLWNLHATFAEPGKILTQIVELQEGSQWFSIARTVRRSITPHGTISPRFAVALGCEIKYANRLVYARRLDLATPDVMPIGISCRLCERPNCPQRAAPPVLRPLRVDETTRGISPFAFNEP
ncbi:short-chain fatty acyl-CoA regulator family protein [Beijerinckia sp. L45]|uniref:helix-turn-helix domain-containing protein n=1 Tax=Beijerinckia sp. L45 TaxID=1641855 RepID=UPI00131E6052|nr:XRE family transcriptional regulator [Beijerinckia sp. L45]